MSTVRAISFRYAEVDTAFMVAAVIAAGSLAVIGAGLMPVATGVKARSIS
jgi:hypothetical protein